MDIRIDGFYKYDVFKLLEKFKTMNRGDMAELLADLVMLMIGML